METQKTKWCPKCETEKSVDEFTRNKSRYKGLQGWCKKCQYAYNVEFAKRKRKTAKGKRALDGYYIKYRWSITLNEYEWLVAKQNGCCALCFKPTPGKRLRVDHDHSHHENIKRGCKECIRGLLCDDCNRKFLSVAEHIQHLQTEFVKNYLKQRPFTDRVNEIANALIKPPASVPPESHSWIPETGCSRDSILPIDCPAE